MIAMRRFVAKKFKEDQSTPQSEAIAEQTMHMKTTSRKPPTTDPITIPAIVPEDKPPAANDPAAEPTALPQPRFSVARRDVSKPSIV